MLDESPVLSDASATVCLGSAKYDLLARARSAAGLQTFGQFFGISRKLALFFSLSFPLLLVQPLRVASQTTARVGTLRGERFQRFASGVLAYELLPSINGDLKGASLRTNRWGMRDNDYELKPPSRTYRIALLGSSLTMGGGVPEELTHEAVLENRLNREGPGAPRRHYEILNFAVMGYGILQNLAVTERKVFPFAPHAVLLALHGIDEQRMISYLVRLVSESAQIEYPYVRQKLQEAGVQSGMESPELRRRLAGVAPDLVKWSFKRVAEICREHQVPVVGILFPEPRDDRTREDKFAAVAAAAAEAGIPVLDLQGVYKHRPLHSMRLGAMDPHLNPLGHRVVADRLFQLLRANDARTLRLGFPAAR